MTGRHRHVSWHLVVMLVGILVAIGSGIQTAYELPASLHDLRPSGEHGMLFMSLYIALRALAEVLVDVQRVGELSSGKDGAAHAKWRDVVAGPRGEALVGFLLVISAVGEAFDVDPGLAPTVHIWHFGLALMGLSLVCQAGHHFIEGLEKLEHARLPAWARHLCRIVCQPGVQIALSGAILLFAVGELVSPPPIEVGTEATPTFGQHGMAAVAGLKMARAGLDLGKALGWIKEAPETAELEPQEVA